MALSLGATTPTALYLGTTAISAAYLGATQVYSTGGGDAYAIGGASPELVAAFTTTSNGTTAGEYFRKAGSETTFGDLFTFSRSGTATYFDSNGTLQTAADGVARRNAYYYNGGWTKGGLQLESAAATNLLPYSQDFTNGAWTKVAATASLLSGDVYEITESGSGSQTPYLIDFVTIASGAAHVISIDVKDVDRGYAFLQWTDAASRFAINVDLSDGAITDTDTVATPDVLGYGSMTFGDGWYRLWIAATSASTSGYLVFGPSDSATPSWTGSSVPAYSVSGAKILARRAQLEPGSIPTSYIPTTGSTVTRAAETLTRNGAGSAFGSTELTYAWDVLLTYDGNGPLFFDVTKSSNEFVRLYVRNAASTYHQYNGDGGPPDYSAQVTDAQGGTVSAGVNQTFAGAYGIKANDFAQLIVNGNAGTAVATTTIENFDGQDMTMLKTEGSIFLRTYREWSTKLSEADLITAGTAS